jgi:hypothetical protein
MTQSLSSLENPPTIRATANVVRELNFSGARIGARFVSQPRDYYIDGRSVVVNPNRTDIRISGPLANIIPPFSSLILENARIASGESMVVLEPKTVRNLGGIVLEMGWVLYATLVPPESTFKRDTPLYRSPQDDIGIMRFDPGLLPGQQGRSLGAANYLVKVNLWFAPEKTDCAIHNQHNFIEIHTQVSGYGRMQKFTGNDFSTIYQDELMAPSYTTAVPFCEVVDTKTFRYPWHQYYADTDCVWMAIEYHPEVL